MSLNRIPGDDNIFIGGYVSLRRKEAMKAANITHVVSVLRMQPDEELFKPYKHITIPVDDVDDEDLIQYFHETNEFIQKGLESGGGVLVHCAMGKSRSATVCIAYMLHRYPHLTPESALALIRESRSLCEPNEGFMEQLKLYHRAACPENVAEDPSYQRWLYQKEVEQSVACGRGPELNAVRFEDESGETAKPTNESDESIEIKCRKCRHTLATTPFIIQHTPKGSGPNPSQQCGHIFLHALSWMRSSLSPNDETGDTTLSGRLTCPRGSCGANVGKFAWQGQKCTCGEWVVPGISLIRGKVDETKKKNTGIQPYDGGASGIRMPPSFRAASNTGKGNL